MVTPFFRSVSIRCIHDQKNWENHEPMAGPDAGCDDIGHEPI
jgi:hypothetical protein